MEKLSCLTQNFAVFSDGFILFQIEYLQESCEKASRMSPSHNDDDDEDDVCWR